MCALCAGLQGGAAYERPRERLQKSPPPPACEEVADRGQRTVLGGAGGSYVTRPHIVSAVTLMVGGYFAFLRVRLAGAFFPFFSPASFSF